jgi:hypothetical protein
MTDAELEAIEDVIRIYRPSAHKPPMHETLVALVTEVRRLRTELDYLRTAAKKRRDEDADELEELRRQVAELKKRPISTSYWHR